MTVQELMKELRSIVKVHPEAKDATVWSVVAGDYGSTQGPFHMKYIAYDTKHKPARIVLEE